LELLLEEEEEALEEDMLVGVVKLGEAGCDRKRG